MIAVRLHCKLLLLALLSGGSPSALACSSCGTGGDDPLILEPSDQRRLYLGVTQSTFEANINSQGLALSLMGVVERQRSVLAWGQRLSRRSFITATMPIIHNLSWHSDRWGMGDPTLAGRYAVLMPSFAQPWRPQIELLGGYKPRWAASVYDASDRRELLDAFGTGYHTFRMGVDVWAGMNAVQWGLSYASNYSLPEWHEQQWLQPGWMHLTNFTLGYAWSNSLRIMSGVIRQQAEASWVDGGWRAGSEVLQHSVFVTLVQRPAPLHELRLIVVDQGRYLQNINTTQAVAITGAYLVSI